MHFQNGCCNNSIKDWLKALTFELVSTKNQYSMVCLLQPTTKNLVMVFGQQLGDALKNHLFRPLAIQILETETIYVEYYGEEQHGLPQIRSLRRRAYRTS